MHFNLKKITLVSPEKTYLFTIVMIQETEMEIQHVKNRKLIILNKEKLTKWNKNKNEIMYEIMLSKYKICSEAAKVLKETGKAELWHIIQLEKIREILNED